MKLSQLAQIIAGEIVGNPSLKIDDLAPLTEAGAGKLAFVLEEKFLAPALASKAAALVVPLSSKTRLPPPQEKSFLLVAKPRLALAKLLPRFSRRPKPKPGIAKKAVVAKSAKIGRRVIISPFVYVGEKCEIGDDSVIHPNVTIYDGTKIGRRVIIHSGSRVGVDGYGYVEQDGGFNKIPQTGSVIIEDDVEIYANVTIARGTLGPTIIRRGTKIDSLVHIAHNCEIGEDCAITALVGFAGSVTLKNRVQVGGMAGFNGHITVGEGTIIMGKSGVSKDIPPHSIVSGFPAIDHKKDLKNQAALRQLLAKQKKSHLQE